VFVTEYRTKTKPVGPAQPVSTDITFRLDTAYVDNMAVVGGKTSVHHWNLTKIVGRFRENGHVVLREPSEGLLFL
jgi:hypothetical protein